MTEVELAYVAGFFDGEGNARVAYPKAANGVRYKKLVVNIAQVDRTVLDWIAEEFGGKVYSKSDKRAAERGWQECFSIILAYRVAEKFLLDIMPYLRIKKEMAQAALDEAYMVRSSIGQDATLSKS